MYTIRLSKNQVYKHKRFKHPLLNDLISYSLEEITPLVERKLNGGNSEELILALRLILKILIENYLYYWPETRRMIDDMVSVGFVALTTLVNNLTKEELENRDIFKLTSIRIRRAIECFVNTERGICLPSLPQQDRLKRKKVEFKGFTEIVDKSIYDKPIENTDIDIIDTLGTLKKLAGDDEIYTTILKEENYSKTAKELESELGVTKDKIKSKRRMLHKRYKNER
jgi:hypothetical protein